MANRKIKRDFNTTASFLILSSILVLLIIGMIIFINIMGENTQYLNYESEVEPTVETTLPPIKDDESISYVTKLSTVLANGKFKNDYEVRIPFQGTNYYFKCLKYDSDLKECSSGFGLLNYNNISIPLYYFDDVESDYATNQKDYYITIDNNFIILTYDNLTNIYLNDGSLFINLNSVLTEFDTTENSISKSIASAPYLDGDKLTYYTCDTNSVIKKELSIKNKKIISAENVENGIC